jgi:hypothetical protein
VTVTSPAPPKSTVIAREKLIILAGELYLPMDLVSKASALDGPTSQSSHPSKQAMSVWVNTRRWRQGEPAVRVEGLAPKRYEDPR